MEMLDPGTDPVGAVLVIHSWWGLTESFRVYGNALAQAGYLVGLADLFDGQIAETQSEARRLRSRPRRVPMYRTLGADIESLRQQMGGADQRIGLVGFSMGGHWAAWLSQRPEYEIAAAILYYAARGGDFSKCKAGLLVHFAQSDEWISGNARSTMERAIAKAPCHYQAFDYPGTEHWFAEAVREREFNAEAAQLACKRDIEHLRKHLLKTGA